MAQLLELHVRTGIKSDGKVEQKYAIVDDEDYEWLAKFTWFYKVDNANDPKKRHVSIGRNSTAEDINHKRASLVLLNRQILDIDDPKIIVHFEDGNPLNNRKENLIIHLDGKGVRRLRKHWLDRAVFTTKLKR